MANAMKKTTKRKGESRKVDASVDNLGVIADKIISRFKRGDMPWQSGRLVAMPRTLEGKPFNNANFLILAGMSDPSEPRWGRFLDFKNHGGHIKKGEEGTNVVFWMKRSVASKDGVPETTIRRPIMVTLFNAKQAEHALPDVERPDIIGAIVHIEKLCQNADLSFLQEGVRGDDPTLPLNLVKDYELQVSLKDAGETEVGEALFALSAWASKEKAELAAAKSGEPARDSLPHHILLNAITGSMLCAEYGVPVPSSIVNMFDRYNSMCADYLEDAPAQVFAIAREATELSQFINQFGPAPDDSDVVDDVAALQAERNNQSSLHKP